MDLEGLDVPPNPQQVALKKHFQYLYNLVRIRLVSAEA